MTTKLTTNFLVYIMLTDTYLKSLKPTGKTFEKADRDGMTIRVSPKGKITFQYCYRFEDKRQRIKYGSFPQLSLADARKAHAKAKSLKEQNINPVLKKQADSIASKEAETVNQLIDEWMTRYATKQRKRPEIPEQVFNADVKPIIGTQKVKDIARRHIIKLLDRILDRGSPVQANKTLSLLKQLFSYAVSRGMIEQSPITEVKKKDVGGNPKPRERCLTDEEIRTFWHRLEQAPLNHIVIIATKILLVTGQRRGEISKAQWADINFETKKWFIPKENSKNGKEHTVPLSPLAITLFERLQKLRKNDWVMHSPRHLENRGLHMTDKAITRAMARNQEFIGIEKWTPHDLRRTCATKLAELGTPPHVVEKILNHTLEGVLAVYNRFDYMPERVEALNSWSRRLLELTKTPMEQEN